MLHPTIFTSLDMHWSWIGKADLCIPRTLLLHRLVLRGMKILVVMRFTCQISAAEFLLLLFALLGYERSNGQCTTRRCHSYAINAP